MLYCSHSALRLLFSYCLELDSVFFGFDNDNMHPMLLAALYRNTSAETNAAEFEDMKQIYIYTLIIYAVVIVILGVWCLKGDL